MILGDVVLYYELDYVLRLTFPLSRNYVMSQYKSQIKKQRGYKKVLVNVEAARSRQSAERALCFCNF